MSFIFAVAPHEEQAAWVNVNIVSLWSRDATTFENDIIDCFEIVCHFGLIYFLSDMGHHNGTAGYSFKKLLSFACASIRKDENYINRSHQILKNINSGTAYLMHEFDSAFQGFLAVFR